MVVVFLELQMAKTKEGKKIVYVASHTRLINDKEVEVKRHYRSTPN
jgi:hypothetical protein